MLVIRRKSGDRILLGGNIEIEILDARQNYVKIGITAPDSVSIVRQEVLVTSESNLKAARSASSADIMKLASRLSK